MKQDDLFHAIGQLDEDLLAESEATMTVRPKRVVWKAVVVAAALAMMVLTVTAAVNRFISLTDSEPEVTWQEFYVEVGVTDSEVPLLNDGKSYCKRITMEIDVNPAVSEALETIYMIQAPEHWTSVSKVGRFENGQVEWFGVIWEPNKNGNGILWHTQDHVEDHVWFSQDSAYHYHVVGDNWIDSLVGIPDRVPVTSEIVEMAGISVLKVKIPAFERTMEEDSLTCARQDFMESGETRLYWSDGYSILSLQCPAWMTDEEIESLLSTIYIVENVEDLNLYDPLADYSGED